MDEFKQYYTLFTRALLVSLRRIGWKELAVAIFSLFMGSTYYLFTYGLNSVREQSENFVVYTLAPLILIAVLFIMQKVLQTPVTLYFGILAEANKYKWDDVVLNIVRPIAENPDGACIKVCNQKGWTIQSGTVQIVSVVRDGVPLPTLDLPFVPWVKELGVRTYQKTLPAKCSLERSPFISLAAWDASGGWLNIVEIDRTNKKIPLDRDVPYKITLEWRGEVDGRRMDEHRTRYLIKYTRSGLELQSIK